MTVTLCISDTHAPYHHKHTLPFLVEIKRRYKPEMVFSVGDMWDLHNFSVHKKHPLLLGPKDEIDAAREFTSQLCREFPHMGVCYGNHDERIEKRLLDENIPPALVHGAEGLMTEIAPGWEFSYDWIVDDGTAEFVITHGMRRKTALLYAKMVGKSVVQGHHHAQFQTQIQNTRYGYLWGMDVGCLADPRSAAAAYGRNYALAPVLGCGLVIDGLPQLVPMRLTDGGDWTGEL